MTTKKMENKKKGITRPRPDGGVITFHVNMTNINTRDGSEDLRAVSKHFRSCFRNDNKLEKDPRGSKITGR